MPSELPERLVRSRNVDLSGRDVERWIRRLGLLLLTAILAAGLAGVFGQKEGSTEADAPAGRLRVSAPSAVRSGLLYQALFEIEAARPIEEPTLVLEDGWLERTTVNSLEPAPVAETERNGFTVLSFDSLAAGESLTVRMSLQANPTALGRRAQSVRLNDGGEQLIQIDHDLVVFP